MITHDVERGRAYLLEALDSVSPNARASLEEFEAALSEVHLPFADFFSRLRKLEYPGYPSFECGWPPCYYYFIPNSNCGSERPFPFDPLHPNFVYSTDSFGFNLGCPLRLKRALEVLLRLPESDQKESRDGLCVPTKHLATVEELLWLGEWKNPLALGRSENVKGKTHDWKLQWDKLCVRLECKLRPSDWARRVDGNFFTPSDSNFLLGKASRQLPAPPENGTLNVVAVTGMAAVDDSFRNSVSQQLKAFKNVGVLLYRIYPGEMWIFSLSHENLQATLPLLSAQEAVPFQLTYPIFHNLAEGKKRANSRVKKPFSPFRTNSLCEHEVRTLPPKRLYPHPPLPYRSELVMRMPDGEPIFQAVTPYI